MPLYVYRCNENGHEFQARQRMVDDPLTECPVCGGPVRRLVSSVGVVVKGSGVHAVDGPVASDPVGYRFQVVPEPGAAGLLGAGALILWISRRKPGRSGAAR